MASESGRPDTLEVELKYPVSDLRAVGERLEELGAQMLTASWESDVYFSAPDRSFMHSDEALRLRRTQDGLWITYKGPRCDSRSKTRREIEVPLHSPAWFDQACALLEHLGYRPIASLYKDRVAYRLTWKDYVVKVSLDNVQHLGTFVELETHASEKDLNRARTALEHLAHRLGLENPERRSYLELYFAYLRSLPFEDLPPLPPIT